MIRYIVTNCGEGGHRAGSPLIDCFGIPRVALKATVSAVPVHEHNLTNSKKLFTQNIAEAAQFETRAEATAVMNLLKGITGGWGNTTVNKVEINGGAGNRIVAVV